MASSNAPKYNPAFSNVLYVTAAKNDQWFIPTTGYGDNADSGTMAQRLDACEELLGLDSGNSDSQIGKAVQPGTLAAWP